MDYLCRLRVTEAADFVLTRLTELEIVTDNRRSLVLSSGPSMYADLLCCNPEYATWVIFELKVGKQTPREAITELLAYEQEVLNHCPFLSHDDLVFVMIGTEFGVTIDHALSSLMTWSNRRVLCLKAISEPEGVSLHVHLPQAWSPIGQGILPAEAVSTADLCLHPSEDLTREHLDAIASTTMELITREADRRGCHGFVMLWEDAMHPEVTDCPLVITAGIINPYAFLSVAIDNGILPDIESLPPEGKRLQRFLLDNERYRELTEAHFWTQTVGRTATAYLKHWGAPAWEGLSTWRALREPDRIDGPAHAMERRARPVAFDFFGIPGEFARDLTSRVALRAEFIPSTVQPGVDWRYPRLGAVILDGLTLPEVVPGGQWTFGAMFELGARLGRLAAVAEAYCTGDAHVRSKLEARLFWAEMDLWEPLHALLYRVHCTDELESSPPTIMFGRHGLDDDSARSAHEMVQWVADVFIGKRSELLRTALALGYESYGLFDGALSPDLNDEEQAQHVDKIARMARDLLQHSVVFAKAGQLPRNSLQTLWGLLEDNLDLRNPEALSETELMRAVEQATDEQAIAMLRPLIAGVVDFWCPQLLHRLAPAKMDSVDWQWLKSQIAQLRSQGMASPGIMLSPNGGIATADLGDFGSFLPEVPDPDTHVLVSLFALGMELILAVAWSEVEAHGFSKIESIAWNRSNQSKQ